MILVLLIAVRVNAFLAFLIASISVGLLSGMEVVNIVDAIEVGLGNTLGSITIILGFGAVLGRLMAESGAAERIANQIVKLFGVKNLKWAMMIVGFLVGIPMFFAVGFVILIPIMFSIARKAGVSFIYLGIPLVAALSATHGLLPPHPAPTAITQQFGANMGQVIMWGSHLGDSDYIVGWTLIRVDGEENRSEATSDFHGQRTHIRGFTWLWYQRFLCATAYIIDDVGNCIRPFCQNWYDLPDYCLPVKAVNCHAGFHFNSIISS